MSKWLSAQETYRIIDNLEDSPKLLDFYALALFLRSAFYTSDFVPDVKWRDYIVLTDFAKLHLDQLHHAGVSFPEENEVFTLFQRFFHHDLYIDYLKSDINGLVDLLSNMHTTGEARWPYIYGNGLYHKFNDTYDGNRTQFLDAAQVEQLLNGTSQGIFQVGKLLSGPLGFLESAEYRIAPPTKTVALWHCSDPGCRAMHLVTLNQYKSAYYKTAIAVHRFVEDSLGPSSEWDSALLLSYHRHKWPNGRPFWDLPAVIGDCIIGNERTRLLVRCLESPNYSSIMAVLNKKTVLDGKPEDVVAKLSQEEQHQLILLIRDEDLINYLDELIANKEILIPPTEVRSIRSYENNNYRYIPTRLSSLGVRSTYHPPLIELSATIWSIYESLGKTDDLLWRLRGHESSSIHHAVIDFIKTHGPEQAVRELILPSREITNAFAEKYFYQIFPSENEESIIKRLLWKMGFTLARYEDEYSLLRDRIGEFQEAILKIGNKPTENEKAGIRAVGVNLFVSVETFLENLICYNTWLLGSDHFNNPRFLYFKDDAHDCVIRILGEKITSGTESFSWNNNGSNSLGSILVYLQAFRSWIKTFTSANRQLLARDAEDYPHYADDALWIFPFKHYQLWADSAPEIMTGYGEIIEKICTQLGQAELPTIRNGIDHKRDDDKFPSKDKMLSCVSHLQQVVDLVDSKRLIPKLFWGIEAQYDNKGNLCYVFNDYRGSSVSLWEPSVIIDRPTMKFGTPILIAPFDFLNQPNSTLIFNVSNQSKYKQYWKNYPRRRIIPTAVKQNFEEIEGN